MIAVARSVWLAAAPGPGSRSHTRRGVSRGGGCHVTESGRNTAQAEWAGGRLGRPAVRQPMVRRPRLAAMLDAGARRPVTLVCAGPGWGKSTLVASWAEARVTSGPIAWLTLGPPHNDPRAFWSDFVMALRMSGAVPCGNPLEALDLGARAGQQEVGQVLDGLDALP